MSLDVLSFSRSPNGILKLTQDSNALNLCVNDVIFENLYLRFKIGLKSHLWLKKYQE